MKYEVPNDVSKIGDIFIDRPLYKRKKKHKLIYYNETLLNMIFGKIDDPRKFLEDYFSVTINDCYKKDDNVIGSAYIDKQKDPTNISLDGNLGSGRAYYLDKNFNLKGELTPLATSPYPVYSNGKLSLESGIHETLISNVLAKDSEPSTYETLALFDSNEEYDFGQSHMKCSVMIRYIYDNVLYRLSHLFMKEKKVGKEEAEILAKNMGILEGNKFMDRLLHGAWSLGNLSVGANMIDFDTTYFVKNRNPAFSFTYKYKTNYFTEEYLGELKILEILLNSDKNIDNISVEYLKEILINSMEGQITKKFSFLMGLDNDYKLNNLACKFVELSKYGYQNYDELNTMNIDNSKVAVFNFSRFFRYYPLLKAKGKFNIYNALNLMLNDEGNINTTENLELKNKIDEYFKKYQINNDKEFLDLLKEILTFINEYDYEFDNAKVDIEDAIINAYIRNEDRVYLFNNSFIKYKLASMYNGQNGEIINAIMNLIIDSSMRNNNNEIHKCDLELYEDYAVYKVIDKNKKEFHFEGVIFFPKSLSITINGVELEKIEEKYISKSYSIYELDEKFDISIKENKIKRKKD